jgi:hypothetical protein
VVRLAAEKSVRNDVTAERSSALFGVLLVGKAKKHVVLTLAFCIAGSVSIALVSLPN